ncbi:MAG: hypothetical protein ACI965_001423 [Paraglaciecola sp.]|jgi:hypothetical protein
MPKVIEFVAYSDAVSGETNIGVSLFLPLSVQGDNCYVFQLILWLKINLNDSHYHYFSLCYYLSPENHLYKPHMSCLKTSKLY